jgi:hypothetical protein
VYETTFSTCPGNRQVPAPLNEQLSYKLPYKSIMSIPIGCRSAAVSYDNRIASGHQQYLLGNAYANEVSFTWCGKGKILPWPRITSTKRCASYGASGNEENLRAKKDLLNFSAESWTKSRRSSRRGRVIFAVCDRLY